MTILDYSKFAGHPYGQESKPLGYRANESHHETRKLMKKPVSSYACALCGRRQADHIASDGSPHPAPVCNRCLAFLVELETHMYLGNNEAAEMYGRGMDLIAKAAHNLLDDNGHTLLRVHEPCKALAFTRNHWPEVEED